MCAQCPTNWMLPGEIPPSDLFVASDENNALKPLLQCYRVALLSLRPSYASPPAGARDVADEPHGVDVNSCGPSTRPALSAGEEE